MLGRMSTVCACVGHDQPHGDKRRLPAAAGGNLMDQAAFSIERPQHLIHVDEFGLEFDDEYVAAPVVPRQLVDDAALAVVRK